MSIHTPTLWLPIYLQSSSTQLSFRKEKKSKENLNHLKFRCSFFLVPSFDTSILLLLLFLHFILHTAPHTALREASPLLNIANVLL